MKEKKLLTKIKTLPKFIKKHPRVSPQVAMDHLNKYTKMASHEYYGQGLQNAMRYYTHAKYVLSTIMSHSFANLVMPPKDKNFIHNNIPKSSKYFVQIIDFSSQKIFYRKLRMNDILKAQKRVLKNIKLIKSKDDYDTNGTLEAERDINGRKMRLTQLDISIITCSCALAIQSDSDPKEKQNLENIFNTFNNENHHIISKEGETRLILAVMKREERPILSQMAIEDRKNWYRLYKKLEVYVKRIQRDESIHNPLLQKAIRLMKAGKVRSSLDTLLTNMEVDHAACRSHCYDPLSSITADVIMGGTCAGSDIQLAILTEMIPGTALAAKEDSIQAKDLKILKKFARHGYRYAALTFLPDDETLKTIKPISWNTGISILNNVVTKFRHYVEE